VVGRVAAAAGGPVTGGVVSWHVVQRFPSGRWRAVDRAGFPTEGEALETLARIRAANRKRGVFRELAVVRGIPPVGVGEGG
jgi:hypothetical protein